MLGCFIAVIVIAVGLSLLAVVGIFLSNFFTSANITHSGPGSNSTIVAGPFTFAEKWGLLEGIVGLLGLAFLILIAYAAIKSFRH